MFPQPAVCLAFLVSWLWGPVRGYSDDGAYPPPGTLLSVDERGQEHSPPVYRPASQISVVSSWAKKIPAPPPYLQQQYNMRDDDGPPPTVEERNCLLCETVESGACGAMPSCVSCETTVTALCEHSPPCQRCTVVKNPFFKCTPGEKYMDECDSCRCTDGRSGWCTNQYCHFRALYLYAMHLSDSEYY